LIPGVAIAGAALTLAADAVAELDAT